MDRKGEGEGMLPEGFIKRMKSLMGEEYPRLEAALAEPAVRGVRVNRLKTSVEKMRLHSPLVQGEPLPYTPFGFIPECSEGIGRTPEHHAGMVYAQDPGAMATVTALDIKDGWRVLDACAAPGGKTTQIAEAIPNGLLLANEYVPARARILVSNLERMGVANATVTSLSTEALGEMYEGFFDLVLCDAPCSGEGMFRKYDEALSEWSEENVRACAERQAGILNNLADTVAPTGYLLYSTCTYSVEENEGVVKHFLDAHPDFHLVPVKDGLSAVTSDGIAYEGLEDLKLTRRFYPHISRGEGQYIALMQRDNGEVLQRILYKDASKLLSKEELRAVDDFVKSTLTALPTGRLIKAGEGVALAPEGLPTPPRSVFMSGVMLGEVRHGKLIPHHQFFSAYGEYFKERLTLARDDPRLSAYLRGEQIAAPECRGSGFLAVFFEDAPLGGGKLSSGRVNNHYPKGLRNK